MTTLSSNLRGFARRFRRAITDRRGGVAVTFAFALPIIVLVAGGAVDLQVANTARRSAQDTIDAAALAAAASSETSKTGVEAFAKKYVASNVDARYVDANPTVTVDYVDDNQVAIALSGRTQTVFLGAIGMSTLPVRVNATATRGAAQNLELALVLDNTWSMSDTAGGGVTKIDALKTAAKDLVTALSTSTKDNVKIAVVPYGDYVNVGVGNRSQPWMDVQADYSVTTPAVPAPNPPECVTVTTETKCVAGSPKKSCTRVYDGVTETYDCTPQVCTTSPVTPYQSCKKGSAASTTTYKWWGCVGSRREGTRRLDDTDPTTSRFPGFLSTNQRCLKPILPLTNQMATVKTTIDGLIVTINGYKPLTYIPAGLIWGVNVLSSSQPMTEGKAYDADNTDPRKVIVLMTDGENTLKFTAAGNAAAIPPNPGGTHDGFSTNATTKATQLKQTNDDTTAVCNYAKSKKIEIYTVALAVKDADAQKMLDGCATSDGKHYYNASDTAALQKAFADIAASINTIRLVK